MRCRNRGRGDSQQGQYSSQNLAQKLKVLKVLQEATFNLDVKISTLFLFQSPHDLKKHASVALCCMINKTMAITKVYVVFTSLH